MMRLIPNTRVPTPFCVAERIEYRISSGLLDSFSEWWHMPVLIACIATVMGAVLWIYHHDAAEIPRWKGVPLAFLRIFAWSILLFGLLDMRRTAEHEITFPSKVAVLVDGSASMTLAANTDSTKAIKKQSDESTSRAKVASNILQNSDFLSSLRNTHEVSVWNFSTNSQKNCIASSRRSVTSRQHDK